MQQRRSLCNFYLNGGSEKTEAFVFKYFKAFGDLLAQLCPILLFSEGVLIDLFSLSRIIEGLKLQKIFDNAVDPGIILRFDGDTAAEEVEARVCFRISAILI